MQFTHITTERQLQGYCEQLARTEVIAFDTEFVSEDTYRPDLCLIQVSADRQLAVIDPRAIENLEPFWEQLTNQGHQTVVHAGREEYLFCLQATGKPPPQWFDVQLAAGMAGMEYPASYRNLVTKLHGKSLSKGETRTDWRRRPLSPLQLEYALQDVIYLEAMRDKLLRKIEQLGRTEWLDNELRCWQEELQRAESTERWRRVSGISGLSMQSLAIVRQLWRWREAEAKRRNRPPRRVLRDDLLVELARRGTSELQRIGAIRGMQHRNLRSMLPEISTCIAEALRLRKTEWPETHRRQVSAQVGLIAQFVATALSSICRAGKIAPSLVGTVQDVRDLVAYRLQLVPNGDESLPALARGWRAEVVGKQIEDLLTGKLSIRITDPMSDEPLSFDPVDGG